MRKTSIIVVSALVLVAVGLTTAIAQVDSRQKALFGVYRGAVVEAADPEGRHRVKIRMPAVSGSAAKWALIVTSAPDGAQAVPEVGDEVVVAFEHGDPDQPIILGRIWNPED